MAANYWASTQRRHWLFSREKLAEIRDRLREQDKVTHSQFPLPDQRLLNIYFNQREYIPFEMLKREADPAQNSSNWASACPPVNRPLLPPRYI